MLIYDVEVLLLVLIDDGNMCFWLSVFIIMLGEVCDYIIWNVNGVNIECFVIIEQVDMVKVLGWIIFMDCKFGQVEIGYIFCFEVQGKGYVLEVGKVLV